MKNFRRYLSLLLAIAMLFSVTSTAFADDPEIEITLNKTELSMLLGGTLEHLEVLGAPEDAVITWASDDWRVARVSDGNVISVGEGRANITATVSGESLICEVSVYTEPKLITNDVWPLDVDGNPIFAQWSTIHKFGDKFYRYGMAIGASSGLYNSQKQGKGTPSGSGNTVRIYSSDDLVSWKLEGTAPAANSFARLGISYNAKNDYYVLTGDSGGVRRATSPTPTGPFTSLGSAQTGMNQLGPDPAIQSASADSTTFYDYKTGKAYIPFVCNGVTEPGVSAQNAWQTLHERDIGYLGVLDEDGTTVVEVYEIYNNHKDPYYNLLREGGREANCMFTYDGWYYYVGSGLRGWNGGPTFYMGGARTPTAKTYTNEVGIPNSMFPMRGTSQSNSHTTQVEGFITVDTPVTGQAPVGQMVLEWGDRFTNSNANGYGLTQFGPLSFLDPATAPPMTEDDLPKYPDPQAYSNGECVNPDNPWKDKDTFYPFLPEDYPHKDAGGNPEWKRPEWPIPVYNDLTQFYFDVANGSWSPGPNNNYLTNSYFENDRLAGGTALTIDGQAVNYPVIQTYVNEPTAWKADHIEGQIAQINYGGNRATGATDRAYQLVKGVQSGGSSSTAQCFNSAWAGNYTWYHGYTKRNQGTDPYKTRTYQTAENLPDGLYTVYGWVQSSGGQNECYMYAKSGGVEYKASLNTPMGDDKTVLNNASTNWKLIVVSEEIAVTNGTCEVGMYSDAAADQWAEFDDIVLIRTGDIEDDYSDGKVRVKLSGPTSLTLADEAEYIISVANANGLATVTLWIEVDGDFLNSIDAKGLIEGFGPIGGIAWTNPEGSTWVGRVTVGALEGEPLTTQEYVDLFKLNFGLRAEGDTAVTIKDIKLSGYDEAGTAVFFESLIKNGTVETEIGYPYSVYDLNKDRVVDQLDLTIAQKYYMATEGDANWDESKIADVNGSGKVDIEDFIMILNNIVW